jgi:hypothetical protein
MRLERLTPTRSWLLRVFAMTLGRLSWLNEWVKQVLVRRLIYLWREVPIILTRHIYFTDKHIVVEDHLRLTGTVQVETLWQLDKFSSLHMGSSRYFQPYELNSQSARTNRASILNRQRELVSVDRIPIES